MNEDYETVEPVDDELAEAIQAVNEAEGELLEAQEQRDKARAALVALLEARGERSVTAPNRIGETYKVTLVSGETTKVDEDALRERIGARAYNKLTDRKLNLKKVEKAVVDGALPLEVLSAVSEVKPRASYPRLTRVITEATVYEISLETAS